MQDYWNEVYINDVKFTVLMPCGRCVYLITSLHLMLTKVRRQCRQEAQLSPSDRAMRLVSSNLANYHATLQKLLIRQVLTKPMV